MSIAWIELSKWCFRFPERLRVLIANATHSVRPPAARSRHVRAAAWSQLGPRLHPYRWSMLLMLAADILAIATQTVIPIVIAAVIDGPVARGDRSGFWQFTWLLLGLALAQTLLYGLRRLPAPGMIDIVCDMRRDLYRHVQGLPFLYHDRNGSGPILSRMMGDVDRIQNALVVNFVWMISNATALLLAAIMLIWIHPYLGLASVLALAPLAFGSTIFQEHFLHAAGRAREHAGNLATSAEELMQGVRLLRSLGGASFAAARFAHAAGEAREAELKKVRLDAAFAAFVAAYPIGVLMFIMMGGGLAVTHGTMTIGSLVAFTAFYFRILIPINWMGYILSSHQEAMSALSRIDDLLNTRSDIEGPAKPHPLPPDDKLDVRIDGVHFRYPGASADALDGISLEIPAGTSLAIVGPTGSGKTTLCMLVNRLLDADQGSVCVGGIDVRDIALPDLRAAVGVAFEEPLLFSNSIRENVSLGREGYTSAELRRALSTAHSDFVDSLPDGLDTILGENGTSLSGGERQRLALARTLLGRPRILILDDPLSQVDERTGNALEEELRQVMRTATSIVVAKRPSTALLADRVALLDRGRIVDIGTHDELLARSSLYRDTLVAGEYDEGRSNG